MHRDDKAPCVASPEAPSVPMLAQVDALPGSERKAAIRDGDGQIGS
jgi:hypothetical protein